MSTSQSAGHNEYSEKWSHRCQQLFPLLFSVAILHRQKQLIQGKYNIFCIAFVVMLLLSDYKNTTTVRLWNAWNKCSLQRLVHLFQFSNTSTYVLHGFCVDLFLLHKTRPPFMFIYLSSFRRAANIRRRRKKRNVGLTSTINEIWAKTYVTCTALYLTINFFPTSVKVHARATSNAHTPNFSVIFFVAPLLGMQSRCVAWIFSVLMVFALSNSLSLMLYTFDNESNKLI